MNRDSILNAAMVEPETFPLCPGITLRRPSLKLFAQLVRIGSPFAAATNGKIADAPLTAVCELLFLLAAPEETVAKAVYRSRDVFEQTVDDFCGSVPLDAMEKFVEWFSAEMSAANKAKASVIEDPSRPPSGNAQRPAE